MSTRGSDSSRDIQGTRHLLADVFATDSDELQCKDVDAQMVLCADAQLDDQQAAQQYPALFRHFRFCPDCRAEYDMLVQLAQLQDKQPLPRPFALPAMPTLTNPASNIWSQRLFSIFFPGFVPAVVGATVRGSNALNFLPVTVTVGAADELQIELDVAQSSNLPELRSLFGTVSSLDPAFPIEGAVIWLTEANSETRQQEQTLTATDEVFFAELTPGRYDLYLRLAGREYVVSAIDLP